MARIINGEYGCPLTVEQLQSRLEELAHEELPEREQIALNKLVEWIQGFI